MQLNDHLTSWWDDYEALVLCWQAHDAAKFPPSCARLDVNGQVLAILDSDVTMLIMKFIDKATLSRGGIKVLKEHADSIRSALPALHKSSRSYFAELVEIADEAVRLASVPKILPLDT